MKYFKVGKNLAKTAIAEISSTCGYGKLKSFSADVGTLSRGKKWKTRKNITDRDIFCSRQDTSVSGEIQY